MRPGQMTMFFLGITVTVSGLLLLSKRGVNTLAHPDPTTRRRMHKKNASEAGDELQQTKLDMAKLLPFRKSEPEISPSKLSYQLGARRTL